MDQADLDAINALKYSRRPVLHRSVNLGEPMAVLNYAQVDFTAVAYYLLAELGVQALTIETDAGVETFWLN